MTTRGSLPGDDCVSRSGVGAEPEGDRRFSRNEDLLLLEQMAKGSWKQKPMFCEWHFAHVIHQTALLTSLQRYQLDLSEVHRFALGFQMEHGG